MKRFTFLLAFSFVFFYGCNKQETTPTADNQQVEATGISAYVLNLGSENPQWEPTTLSGAEINSGSSALKQNNSAHTHGSFNFFGFILMEWSGTENNGGTHGSAFNELILGPPFNTTIQITMETECVVAEGNRAVYGGTITEVVDNPLPPGLLEVGYHIYFRVTDNGQGNNAPPDTFTSGFYTTPTSLCGVISPSSSMWDDDPRELFEIDIDDPGSVKVNN